jgi:hypothetical protein
METFRHETGKEKRESAMKIFVSDSIHRMLLRVLKMARMRWAKLVAHMKAIKKTCSSLVNKN